jgi:hypothetical protein
MSNVLVIPDLQTPFEHQDALKFLKAVNKKYNCNRVINIGDEVDFYSLSEYAKSPEALGPKTELDEAIRHLKPFYKAFPRVDVVTSNHTDRAERRRKKAGLPAVFMKSIGDVLQAPRGWKWQPYLCVDGVRFEHGHELFARQGSSDTALKRAAQRNNCSTVFGHFHSCFGIHYAYTIGAGRYFTMCVGCLVDDNAYAFDYHAGPPNSQLGCGVVLNGVPHLVPMKVDENNRWVGRL